MWDGACWFSNDCYLSEYRPIRGVSRGFSFCDAGRLWEQAGTQGDVCEGVDADALEEEEWQALADERAWRDAKAAIERDVDAA